MIESNLQVIAIICASVLYLIFLGDFFPRSNSICPRSKTQYVPVPVPIAAASREDDSHQFPHQFPHSPRERREYMENEPGQNTSTRSVLDAGDLTITDADVDDTRRHEQNVSGIDSAEQRFQAAKRNPVSDKLNSSVHSNQKRRRLVEALLRRPTCGRRTRSWRGEFSDHLRGDVVPKVNPDTNWNMMRVGHSDPEIDLRKGALQTIAAGGKWDSDSVPVNYMDDIPYMNS